LRRFCLDRIPFEIYEDILTCRHATGQSGSGFEGDFGGEAEGIEEAEEKVGGDGFGVAVEDGGDAGARSAG